MPRGPCVGILAAGDVFHVRSLAAALERLGCRAIPAPIGRLVARIPRPAAGGAVASAAATLAAADLDLGTLDAVLVRFIPPGSLDQIVYRVDALHLLHDAGIPVVNAPRTIERTVDKHWTSALLAAAGVPTPRTIVVETLEDAHAAFRDLEDVLVKPLLGSGGRGIVRADDEDVADRVFRALLAQSAVLYLQEFVPHGTSDLRFLVVGGRVVAAARRRAAGWKTNVAAGAEMHPHRPRPEEEELAVRAAAAVQADYAGVDILEDERAGLLVAEVNGIPGWSALQRTTSIDLAGEIARHVCDRIAAVDAARPR